MASPKIEGGYILLARKITISEIMAKPPLYMKLWVWMLKSANHKKGYRGLERGQFFTTKKDMREAMSWMVGYRKVTPTEKEIRNPYEWFLEGRMIVTKKVIHGTLITICNYDEYQNPKNYEGQSEGQSENPTKGKGGAKYKQEPKEVKNDKKDYLPDWLDLDLWKDYLDHRKHQGGKNISERSEKINITELKKFVDMGYTQKELIERTIANGWKGFFQPKTQPRQKGAFPGTGSLPRQEVCRVCGKPITGGAIDGAHPKCYDKL